MHSAPDLDDAPAVAHEIVSRYKSSWDGDDNGDGAGQVWRVACGLTCDSVSKARRRLGRAVRDSTPAPALLVAPRADTGCQAPDDHRPEDLDTGFGGVRALLDDRGGEWGTCSECYKRHSADR